MSRRGWLLFGAMCLIWGIPYLLIKVAVGDLSPASLVFLRTGVGAIVLVPLAAARGSISPLFPYWKAILIYTLVEVTVPWVLLSDAETQLSSSLTGLLVAAVPLVGALLVLFTGGDDRLDFRRVVGLVLGFVGVAALLGLNVSSRDLRAAAEVAVVVLGYATGPIIIARRLSSVPAVGVVAASLAITALVYAPVGLAQMPGHFPSTKVVLAVAVLGVVCTALAFLIFFALIAAVGPGRAQVITYVNPAVALALGVTLLGERFSLGAAAGCVLILIGLLLATRRGRQARAPDKPPEAADRNLPEQRVGAERV